MGQTSYHLICQALREFLVKTLESGDRGAVGTVAFQASATLYALLLDHPLDRRGRCQSCRRSATVFTRRRRRCRVHSVAGFYLLHSGDFLLSYIAGELGLDPPHSAEIAAESGTASRRSAPARTGGASDAY